jgi:hypothetical protein
MTHPMTPPPEQFCEWMAEAVKRNPSSPELIASYVADQAYAAGADAELNACCVWIESMSGLGGLMTSAKFRCTVSDQLRAARRPKPTPQQRAIAALKQAEQSGHFSPEQVDLIRVALEANS